MERCCKTSTHLNAGLLVLVEDKDFFKTCTTAVRKDFDQKAKDCMEAIKSLRKTIIRAGWSFQESHCPQSWGDGISRDRGTKKFNKPVCCTIKYIKTFKPYELSLRKQASKQVTHYRDSEKYQGVKPCNQ